MSLEDAKILLTKYHKIGTVIWPYYMRHTPADYRSDFLNTDKYGLRFAHDAEGVVDSRSWWQRKLPGLAMGDSFSFGVGASNDRTSMVSCLNFETGISFLNLAIIGANSTQELIAAIPFLTRAKFVVFYNGVNNLFLNIRHNPRYPLFGAFYGEDTFERLARTDFRALSAMMAGQSSPYSANSEASENTESEDEISIELTPEGMEESLGLAVSQYRRDLLLVRRACDPDTQVFFAMQAFPSAAKPVLSPEEKETFDFYYSVVRNAPKVIPYLEKLWKEYTFRLGQACSEVGVHFTDLSERKFDGPCFYDPIGHLTDRGQMLAARHISEWIENTTSSRKEGR